MNFIPRIACVITLSALVISTTLANGLSAEDIVERVNKFASIGKELTMAQVKSAKASELQALRDDQAKVVDELLNGMVEQRHSEKLQQALVKELNNATNQHQADKLAQQLTEELTAKGMDTTKFHARAARASDFGNQASYFSFGRARVSSSLNVRSAPSTSSSVIGSLINDEVINISDETQPGWYEIEYYGERGWVSKDYVSKSSIGGVVISQTNLNVRGGPGTDFGIMASLAPEARVKVVGHYQNSWYEIQMGSDYETGWVSGDYLTFPEFNE